MKLIDNILKRFGYIKVPSTSAVIKKIGKHDFEIIELDYEVQLGDEIHDNTVKAVSEYEVSKELLHILFPFLNKLIPRKDNIVETNLRNKHKYNLRIFVAKPK